MKTNKQLTENRIKLSKIIYKDMIKSRPTLAGAWVENDKQIMCDEHIAVKYNTIFEGLVEASLGDRVNIDYFFENIKNKRIIKVDIERLNILYKTAKKINKELYNIIKIENIYVKANLFLEVLSTFDDDVNIYIGNWYSFGDNVIYIKNKDGEGIILPLNKKARIDDNFVLQESMNIEDVK
ncbi:MAG: hypothetical protein RR054_04430 [Clostridia bacterium]